MLICAGERLVNLTQEKNETNSRSYLCSNITLNVLIYDTTGTLF